jgi:hypothetical protein
MNLNGEIVIELAAMTAGAKLREPAAAVLTGRDILSKPKSV